MSRSDTELFGEPVLQWSGAQSVPSASFSGTYAELAPTNPELHSAQLLKAFSRDQEGKIWNYLSYGPFKTAEEYKIWLAQTIQTGDPFLYSIFDKKKDGPLGVFALMRIDQKMGSIELGHVLFSPELQRTRTSTEAVFLIMSEVFARGYRRFEWKCNSLNQSSKTAALRYGFKFEGRFRQHSVSKGRSRDTDWYSIIDKEWPKLKSAYERWLAPSNFDSEGKQRVSLSSLTE